MAQSIPVFLTQVGLAQVGGEGAAPANIPSNDAPGAPDTSVTTAPGGPGATNTTSQGGIFGDPLFMMMMAVLAVFLFMSIFGGRKEKKKRQEMLNSLSKGDEVETVGGEIGTVVSVKGDEVLLKVDENANTKIRYRRSAIQIVRESKPKNGANSSNANESAASDEDVDGEKED